MPATTSLRTFLGAVLLLVPFAMAFPLQDVHWTVKWLSKYTPSCQFPGVATRDGTIYANTGPSILAFALNGTLQWNLTLGSAQENENGNNCKLSLGQDGTLYAKSTEVDRASKCSIYAVNPNGTVKWIAAPGGPNFGECSSARIALNSRDDTLYVQSTTGYIIALTDGNFFWSKFIGLLPRLDEYPQPVFDQGVLYVSTEDTVLALMPNGDVKWRFHLAENTTKKFALKTVTPGPAGTIYVSVYVGPSDRQSLHLYALGPEGALNWDLEFVALSTNTVISGPPAVSLDGSLVFVPVNENCGAFCWLNYLVAVTAQGTIKWRQAPAKSFFGPKMSPVVGLDGNVYISDSHTGLSALTPGGVPVWSFEFGNVQRADAIFPPVFTSDGNTMIVPEFLPGSLIVLQSA